MLSISRSKMPSTMSSTPPLTRPESRTSTGSATPRGQRFPAGPWILTFLILAGCSEDPPAADPTSTAQGESTGTNADDESSPTLSLISAAEAIFKENADSPKEASFREEGLIGRMLAERQYDTAIQILDPIIKANPGLHKPRMLLALAHHKSKRYAQARPMWEDLLKTGPAFEKADGSFYYYGWCLYYLGEPEHGRAAFQAYLDVSGSEADDCYFGIGLCGIELGELEDAKKHLTIALDLIEKGIAKDPRMAPRLSQPFAKTHARLGEVAMLNNELKVARDHLIIAVDRMPQAHEAWFLLSRTYTRLGEDDLAEHAKKQHDEWEQAARTGRKG